MCCSLCAAQWSDTTCPLFILNLSNKRHTKVFQSLRKFNRYTFQMRMKNNKLLYQNVWGGNVSNVSLPGKNIFMFLFILYEKCIQITFSEENWQGNTQNRTSHRFRKTYCFVLVQTSMIKYEFLLMFRYWRLLNETWVLIHGTVVALQTANPNHAGKSIWPIFAFGFGFVLAFTQVKEWLFYTYQFEQ